MAAPQSDSIEVSVRDGVGELALNQPERMNVFTLELGGRLREVLAAFREDEAVRAVVIRGRGRVFSAGGDVHEMMDDVRAGVDRAAFFDRPLRAFNAVTLDLAVLPKPVVAALHGAVAGVAFNIALACDLRVAMEGTRFTQAFVRLGLSPDGGGSWALPRLVGHARACELTMLPTVIDAETALAWGLVNRVVPSDRFDAEVATTARALADGPAQAIARTKTLLAASWERSLPEQIEAERLAQVGNAAAADFEEGLTAFCEKRTPRFR